MKKRIALLLAGFLLLSGIAAAEGPAGPELEPELEAETDLASWENWVNPYPDRNLFQLLQLTCKVVNKRLVNEAV